MPLSVFVSLCSRSLAGLRLLLARFISFEKLIKSKESFSSLMQPSRTLSRCCELNPEPERATCNPFLEELFLS